MADESGLPADVLTLLHRALPSMVHIELLLLLRRTAPRGWTPHEAAVELRSSDELVAAAFADLDATGLTEGIAGTEQRRLNAADDRVMQAVIGLHEVYERRPVTLIKALYKRPPASVQAFADAFRIRPG